MEHTEAARRRFAEQFGYPPTHAAIAPGRVNLMGDHTDYAGGFALPCAIDLYTVAVAAARPDADASRIVSGLGDGNILLLPTAPGAQPEGDWGDYLRGVQSGFLQRGLPGPALDVAIDGNLPIGAGLSSSAALELCFASLLEEFGGVALKLSEKALLCQQAENEFAGMPCGILDQFAITFAEAGHAMLLDCASQEVTQTPMVGGAVLVIINSGVSHDLVDGEYARRRSEVTQASDLLGRPLRGATDADMQTLADPLLRRRARHVVTENRRVHSFAEALGAGDWARAGILMQESHRSLAQDFEVSCKELDWLAGHAVKRGAYGARMTGGGFGGSVVCLCEAARVPELQQMVDEDYRAATGCAGELRVVRAVDGVRCQQLATGD